MIIAPPGVSSTNEPDANHIELMFTEPLNPATASVLGNYVFSGGSLTAVALSVNNTKMTLTTSVSMVFGTNYTVTVNNVTTASSNQMPASQVASFTFAQQGLGYILHEVWTGIGGSNVSDLTGSASYPSYPSSRDFLTSFEGPVNWADSYGDRIRGYIYPPQTGNYTFWIASDDASQLWLSTDDNPANKVQIAYVTGWTNSRAWTTYASQQSALIPLVAGHKYYIETLHKEGGGGDNIAVRWQLPDGTWENGDSTLPIPGNRLSPFGVLDPTPPTTPANLRGTLVNNNQVNLSWDAANDPESGVDHYIIYRDGSVYGTSPTTSFTDSTNITPQARHTYQISAVNSGNLEGLKSLSLSIAAVGIASVSAPDTGTVRITFTEPVDTATAQAISTYNISGGVTISATTPPHLEADHFTVTLTTSNLGSSSHTLTVTGLHAIAGATLPVMTNTFTVFPPGWAVSVYGSNQSGTIGSLATAQSIIDNPSYQSWVRTENAPTSTISTPAATAISPTIEPSPA